MKSFHIDPHPGKPKILFIGYGESSHTHSWIDLLENEPFNLRLFALPSGIPSESWPVKTYITAGVKRSASTMNRLYLCPFGSRGETYKRIVSQAIFQRRQTLEERWLAQVIRQWRPDIIHTLGLEPASYLYRRVRESFGLQGIGKWVVQVRGGSDVALTRLIPEGAEAIRSVVQNCDSLLADNRLTYQYCFELGLPEARKAPIGPLPGTGGIDVKALSQCWSGPPSRRNRTILMPKVQDITWAKALPLFEAIQIAWDSIQPCRLIILAVNEETYGWFLTLPQAIQRCCRVEKRIPRSEFLDLLTQSRIMPALSLIDGVPNCLYEAMAAGAFPIVSPLDTIRPVVEHEKNVLFARNLYPHEIAGALCRAMNDDALVDRAAAANLELVRQIADRAKIQPRVAQFYQTLIEKN